MPSREKQIIRTSWIGILGNFILAASKITIGLISGSMAVVGDGIESASDIITSWVTLFTARIISKPPDPKHPYGYHKADTLATLALAFIIFFAGAQLLISTIILLIKGEVTEMPSMLAVYVTLFSIVGKFFLSFIHFRVGKRIKSPMLIANGKNMQNDILLSVGVLLGLFFTFILKLPVLDKITALLVGIWIMKTGFQIFLKTNVELMDGVNDPKIYNRVFEIIGGIKEVYNPHKVRIRQIGHLYLIAIDIEVDRTKTVEESHEISKKVEDKLKEEIVNVYDILVHIEPYGNIEKEVFGVKNEDLDT